MKIIAIIVTYNGMKWYNKCFESLRHSTMPVEIVVIDNKSSDETIPYIKENYPEIYLIESDENLGFGKANNIGFKYAIEQVADYIFLINQDAWIKPDTIDKLVKAMRNNQEYGILSPMHLGGNEQSLDYNFSSYILPVYCPNLVSDAFIKNKIPNKIYPISFVNAAFWLISRECLLSIGGFDPIFPHYGEDNNYINRLNIHGYSTGIYPHAWGTHDRIQDETKITFKQKKNRDFISGLVKLCDPSIIFRKAMYWAFYPILIDMINNVFHFKLQYIYINLYTFIKLVFYFPRILKSRNSSRQKGLTHL